MRFLSVNCVAISQMDSVGATWVNMVMDRLHALEEKYMQEVGALKQQNQQLTAHVQELRANVYLREDLRTFSDGCILQPGFGTSPDMIYPDMASTCCISHMAGLKTDDLHLDAIALQGRFGFDIELGDEEDEFDELDADILIIGEDNKTTTVRQLLAAFNKHCCEVRAKMGDLLCDVCPYEGFHLAGHSPRHDVPVYSLTTDMY